MAALSERLPASTNASAFGTGKTPKPIKPVRAIRAQRRTPRKDHRTTFHHTGYFTPEQARRAAQLGVKFSANPYHLWVLADKYSETGLGTERSSHMVALHELTRRGSPVSLHSDFSMAPPAPSTSRAA